MNCEKEKRVESNFRIGDLPLYLLSAFGSWQNELAEMF
jgi:hypothetical protein